MVTTGAGGTFQASSCFRMRVTQVMLATVVTGEAMIGDDAGQDLAQVLFARIVGIGSEGLDAFVEAGLGENESDALEVAIDATLVDGFANGGDQIGGGGIRTLHARDVLDRILTFLVERVVESGDLLVGDQAKSPIENGQGGETILDLIHNSERLPLASASEWCHEH